MILIRERKEDSLERIYSICEPTQQSRIPAQNDDVVGIDESDLAWFYIAPGHENRESCRRLLALARDLIGADAWAVLQAGDTQCQTLCRDLGLRIEESYLNEATGPSGVSVHIVQIARTDTGL